MKKILLSILLVVLYIGTAFTQISEGGTPPSFNYPSVLRSGKVPYSVKMDSDIEKLLAEDSISALYKEPVRIATVLPVNIDIKSNGAWTTLPSKERIWNETIFAEGAKALILNYKEFYIPEGGKLFIYNKDHSMLLGAFTENTNPEGDNFSTQMIVGDEIILEYVDSKVSTESPRIVIENIGYVYKPLFKDWGLPMTARGPAPGGSDKCLIDVNCVEGAEWHNQKRGVVFISMMFPAGWYVCSGSLVNNTNNDGAPYILTANHCFFDESNNTKADFTTAQFYFNYEHITCRGTKFESLTQSMTGSVMLADTKLKTSSDGLLLKLNKNVPLEYNPYYNGWDINNIPAQKGFIIHHPAGDAKKISTFTQTAKSSSWWNSTASNTHWEIYYASTTNGKSVTEGGSSGSPMFNNDGLIVGTLSGGRSYCEITYDKDGYAGGPNESDLYGKLAYHWNRDADSRNHMKTYLAPTGNVSKLSGYDPNGGSSIENGNDTKSVNLILFPSPAENDLNVNTRGIIKSLFVYDILGHLVYTANDMQSSTTVVPVTGWLKGIYNVVVETEEGNRFVEKFTKK